MKHLQNGLMPTNPTLTLAKFALGLLIEQRASQFAPFYHAGNIVTANNLVDLSINTFSFMNSSAMRSTFRY